MGRFVFPLFIVLFFGANSLKASELAPFFLPDSLPQPKVKIYRGYRLSLHHFQLENYSKKVITLRCDAANTGRLPVIYSEKSPPIEEMFIELDTANLPPMLQGHEAWVTTAILKEKINLAPGKMKNGIVLKCLIVNELEEKAMVEKPVVVPKKEVEKPIEKPAKPTVKPPEKTEPPAPKKKPVEPEILAKTTCADLVFDSIWVVKQTSKAATLGFIILNRGNGPALIQGKTKKEGDNLAVNVYFSGAKRLTRGALLADGIFIANGSAENGLLPPQKRLAAEIKISLAQRTRFMPNLIFELDPFQTVDECDKTNNTRTVDFPEN